jgi:hypothetical protein
MLFCRWNHAMQSYHLALPHMLSQPWNEWHITFHFYLLWHWLLLIKDVRFPSLLQLTGLAFCCHKSAMPFLRHLVYGLSLQRPGFNVRAVHVGFMVGRVALGQSFHRVLKFSLATVIHPVLCNHTLFICRLSHVIVVVDSVVNETLNTVPLTFKNCASCI